MFERVNKETLWQVLKMQDVGGKFLNRTKRMYVESLPSVRLKVGKLSVLQLKTV